MAEKVPGKSVWLVGAAFAGSLLLAVAAAVVAFFVAFAVLVGPGDCSANGIAAIFVAPLVGLVTMLISLPALLHFGRKRQARAGDRRPAG